MLQAFFEATNLKTEGRKIMTDNLTLPPTRIEIFKDESKKWRWRLISKAEIRTESPQGYVSKQGCLIALDRVKSIITEAALVEHSG